MNHTIVLALGLAIGVCAPCRAGTVVEPDRSEAEYYVNAYAQHYNVPVALVRSIVEQESGWHRCPISSKGAAGLMQIMPATAQRLGLQDRCDINQNISGGVRYLAWLIRRFRGDLRLAVAAYYVGEKAIERRGLAYSNPDVVRYVASVQSLYRKHSRERERTRPQL